MSEKTVSLILAFLNTNKVKIFSNIQTSRAESHIPYTCMTFNYMGNDVTISIYNDSFIKISVDDQLWSICDNINTVRNSIHKLETHNYGYR